MVVRAASNGLLAVVIDDDPKWSSWVARILTLFYGFNVVIYDDASKSLNQIKKGAIYPDLILVDMAMTPMDGYQFLRQYRETNKTLPVICMTSIDSGKSLDIALTCGASATFLKDDLIKIDRLLDLIIRQLF